MSLRKLVNKVHNLDCIDFLKMIPDNTIESCVTDPPYGLNFMGVSWDSGTISFNIEMWDLVRRALKPGAHLLAFSGTRTYHRLASAIEDAGFEIRNQIHWLYGSGFPKGLNVSNTIIESQLTEWLLLYPDKKQILNKATMKEQAKLKHQYKLEAGLINDDGSPKIQEAIDWLGWNTQLKPAHEPIVVARKPLGEKTVVKNISKWGVGAMNIGACRIAVNPDVDAVGKITKRSGSRQMEFRHNNQENTMAGVLPSGRYPANLILSHHPDCELIQEGNTVVKEISREAVATTGHGIYSSGWVRNPSEYSFDNGAPDIWKCVESCPVRILNEQSGNLSMGGSIKNVRSMIFGGHGIYGGTNLSRQKRTDFTSHGDSGGAARFFYCAKTSNSERNAGLNGRNIHITVKPLDIVRWLVRLVTPKGGIVLDPFLGSGTTAIAAENESMNWLGSDINKTYCEIAKLRIRALGGKSE